MQNQVSTLAVKDKLLVVGGFHGKLICKYLDRSALHFIASNNDCQVRDFDANNFQLSNHLHFGWPVN
ncbi:hypothetical protein OROMI_018760 [Orobanche minor]